MSVAPTGVALTGNTGGPESEYRLALNRNNQWRSRLQILRVGNRRVHRPWVTEPGMWLQYDYGDGPLIDGVKTVLFVAWVA